MSFANINGINLSYRIYGNGFPVILIHGYGAKKEVWKPQIVELSKKFKVITFDLRGTGESYRPNISYTMKILAEDVNALIDFLQIEKAHIIGRSFGGMIAQNFTLLYSKKVEKLVLIATNYGRADTEWVEIPKNGRLEEIENLKHDPLKAFKQKSKWVFHIKFRKEMEANPTKKFYNIFSMEDLIRESTINPSRPQDIINQAEAMKTHYTLEKLGEIKNKTLLIAASHDRQTPASVMMEMNKIIPNSELKIINEAGHFMTLSRASEVNRIILEFLED
ncbi:MAG: alpha/beta hydrolase [Candidatus Lokiarchaeota archaeon]|nr:alpha/beta hydrolase [Candidatus Lokiarchaeota archaeon]